jgi:uncharacterized tellurite resistance protein B-like protein
MKMNKIQAAFEILYFLCAADGNVDDREVSVIREFLEANYTMVSFDPHEVINDIEILNSEGRLEEFTSAVMQFKTLSAATDRRIFLNFAVKLIVADGSVSEGEDYLFKLIANTWGIDISSFISVVAL